MKKKLKKALSLLTVFSMIMGMLCAPAFGMENSTPYWKMTREVDGATQTITHAVLDSNGNLVNIGAAPGALDADNLESGTMAAQKFGAFEDADDAAKGIVKLTFDVAGKPVEVPGPLDVVIIADESGSLNMYGRSEQNIRLGENKNTGPQNIRTSASYMPCLNGEHAYLAGDLQRELYQIALARLNAAAGSADENLAAAVAEALAAEDPVSALAALLTEENGSVAAAEDTLAGANAALAAAEEAHAPFAEAVMASADAVNSAEAALEEAKGALVQEAAAVAAAQSAAAEAQTAAAQAQDAVTAAENAVNQAQTAVTAAEAAFNAAQEESEIAAAEAALNDAKAVLFAAKTELDAAKVTADNANAALTAANEDLAAANTAYEDAYKANEAIAAAEAALAEARTAYNEAAADAQLTAGAVAEAKIAVSTAASSLEAAKSALAEKKAAVDALVSVKEMESKLAGEQVAADIYINPHDAGLEYTVFSHWGNAGNESAVRKMIEAGKFVDGTSANIEIPDNLTDDDVYLALLSAWDEVTLKSNGHLTFTTNYPVIKDGAETGEFKAESGKRMGWNPDTAHCYFADGSYVLIDQPVNDDTVAEESKPYYTSDKLYSYWSPDVDNAYGCFDRMIIEKEGIISLANQILNADPVNNRVAYVGFTRGAYPSLSSYGLGDNGFCGLYDEDLDEMLSIMGNTNGHDYTNYIHPLYMARKIISMREDQNRPCYVVFISDGVPTQSGGFTQTAHVDAGGWNVLSLANEDYPWYDDVYNNSSTHVEAAGKMAAYFKSFLEETAGDDTQFYTVGFSTNEAASGLLKSMASDEDSFFNCSNVSEFMSKMQVVQQEIMIHYPSGVLTDIIGDDFNLLVDSEHPFTVDGTGYASVEAAAAAGSMTVDGAALSWNLENVDEDGVQISFYVKLTDEELNKFEDGITRVYDTNADSEEAAGANLVYHKLIVDSTKSEGYYAEEEATNVPMKTPQLKIWNGEVVPDDEDDNNGGGDDIVIPPGGTPGVVVPPADTPEEEVPPVDVPEEDIPLADGPEEDDPLADVPEEDVPLTDVPKTGDAFTMWMFMSAVSGTCLIGMNALNYKKREEE